jgi:LuxR family maltose regulon positive regulatory protein
MSSVTPFPAIELHISHQRPTLVAYSRLAGRSAGGLAVPLALVSIPPGFGQTTMVSTQPADSGCRAAWLSLDAGDSDPARFLNYLIAAIRSVIPQE